MVCRVTDHTRKRQIKVRLTNGKVATTEISYSGTMSNGLATTGADGLEVIIAEAEFLGTNHVSGKWSSVTSPGAIQVRILTHLLNWLTLATSKLVTIFVATAHHRPRKVKEKPDQRRWLQSVLAWPQPSQCSQGSKLAVFTHGSWTTSNPLHVYQMFHALPCHINKHLFFHHGAHV